MRLLAIPWESPDCTESPMKVLLIEGRIIEKQPQNRNNVKYAYEVGGIVYEGTGGPGDRFETIKPGDPITVYYDPQDPGFSLLGTSAFNDLFAETLLMSAVFSVIAGSLFTLGFLGFRLLKWR